MSRVDFISPKLSFLQSFTYVSSLFVFWVSFKIVYLFFINYIWLRLRSITCIVCSWSLFNNNDISFLMFSKNLLILYYCVMYFLKSCNLNFLQISTFYVVYFLGDLSEFPSEVSRLISYPLNILLVIFNRIILLSIFFFCFSRSLWAPCCSLYGYIHITLRHT